MKAERHTDGLIPSALRAEVEAMAANERRPAHEMVREAIERYLRERRASARNSDEPIASLQLTPREAAARLLELRKGNVLPEGMTVRDMQRFGRA